jgi:hypothetical protein
MSFFGRLFGRARPNSIIEPAPPAAIHGTLYGGQETLEVVGESFYQDAIWAEVGGRRQGRITHDIQAVLVPEFDNPHDPNAVRVGIHGRCVGHLSRADAEVYRPGLLRLMERSLNGLVCLRGQVIGGHHDPTELYFLGVFLDHDPADFGIPPRVAATIGFRTGLSEAFAADALDDSYDLSWYHDIPDNDIRAIQYLRGQLAVDPDPIDRHYMMAELECRLYKSRDAFASALDEYDQVCVQHDAEMATIAPALYSRFGKLPVLDTYRQACIRQQKAKNWPAAKWWAERGLAVYGPQAGVEGVVEDLTKRLNQAIAKLEAASQPKPARRHTAAQPSARPVGELEVLVCAACGVSFERVRTRGRKPHACPSCRAA